MEQICPPGPKDSEASHLDFASSIISVIVSIGGEVAAWL